MHQSIFILLALSCLCICMKPYNQIGQMSEQQMRATKATFCGPELSSALSLVCKGAYNAQSKKSINDIINPYDYDTQQLYNPDENQYEYPFVSRENAFSMLPILFRKRGHGIVDECCRKSCSVMELRSYCRL